MSDKEQELLRLRLRLIEAVFFKSSHYVVVDFFIALLFQKEICQESRMMLTFDNFSKEKTFVLLVSNLSESKSD